MPRALMVLILVGVMLGSPGRTFAQSVTSLPQSVWNAVSTDAATQTGVPLVEVTLLRFVPVIFNDGCLGLGRANESCILALTDGYVVWVAAGDTVLRYHTDTSGNAVRLAPERPSRQVAMAEPIPDGVRDRRQDQIREQAGRIVSGETPRGGGFGLVVFGGGTTAQLRTGLDCAPVLPMNAAFWATVDGQFVVYVPASQVGAVNERWHEAFQLGIPPNTPLLVRCQ